MSIPTFLNAPDGSVTLNPAKNFIKGTVLAPGSGSVPVVVAAKATNDGQSIPIILQAPTDGAIEILSMMGAQRSGVAADIINRFKVTIQETGRGQRQLMNRSILCNHVFGTSPGQPYFLPESIFLEPDQTLQCIFYNASTSGSSSFDFACEACKYQTVNVADATVDRLIRKNRFEKDIFYPFWLTADSHIQIPAGGSAVAYFTNTKDQWLVLWNAMATAISSGVAGDTTEFFSAEILDPRTARPLQNQPFTLNTGFGVAGLPYRFPTGWLIEPESQIVVYLKNLVTDQPTDVYMTFGGTAAYSHEMPGQMNNIFQSRPLPKLIG